MNHKIKMNHFIKCEEMNSHKLLLDGGKTPFFLLSLKFYFCGSEFYC
jgi:hypothetical protein